MFLQPRAGYYSDMHCVCHLVLFMWVAHGAVILCRKKRGLKSPVRINTGQSCCWTWTRTCWFRLIMKGWERCKITPQIPNVITSGPCHRARESWCHADACPALCATPLNMLTFAAQQDTGDSLTLLVPNLQQCFSKARRAAVALQPLAKTLIQIQMLWSHRRGAKRIPRITLSLSFWNDETGPLRDVETRRRDGSPAWISFQASATKHLSLFLMDKTWHLSALDLQRCTLFHNTADAD